MGGLIELVKTHSNLIVCFDQPPPNLRASQQPESRTAASTPHVDSTGYRLSLFDPDNFLLCPGTLARKPTLQHRAVTSGFRHLTYIDTLFFS